MDVFSLGLFVKFTGWLIGMIVGAVTLLWALAKGVIVIKNKLIDNPIQEVKNEVKALQDNLTEVEKKIESVDVKQQTLLDSIKTNNDMTMLHIEKISTQMDGMKELVLSKNDEVNRRLAETEKRQQDQINEFLKAALAKGISNNVNFSGDQRVR